MAANLKIFEYLEVITTEVDVHAMMEIIKSYHGNPMSPCHGLVGLHENYTVPKLLQRDQQPNL